MFKEILSYVNLNSDKLEKLHPTITKGKYELSFVIKGSNNKVLIQTINDAIFVKSNGGSLFTISIEEVLSFLEKEFKYYYNSKVRGGEGFFITGSTTIF